MPRRNDERFADTLQLTYFHYLILLFNYIRGLGFWFWGFGAAVTLPECSVRCCGKLPGY